MRVEKAAAERFAKWNPLDPARPESLETLLSVPYPEFCSQPNQCAGTGYCRRDPTCAD